MKATTILPAGLLLAPALSQGVIGDDLDFFTSSLERFEPPLNELVQLKDTLAAGQQILDSLTDDASLTDFYGAADQIWNARFGSNFTVGVHGFGSTLGALPVVAGINAGTLVGSSLFHLTYAGEIASTPQPSGSVPASAVTVYGASLWGADVGDQLLLATVVDLSQLSPYAGLGVAGASIVALAPVSELPPGPLTAGQVVLSWTLDSSSAFPSSGDFTAWIQSQLPQATTLQSNDPAHPCALAHMDELLNTVAVAKSAKLGLIEKSQDALKELRAELASKLTGDVAEGAAGAAEESAQSGESVSGAMGRSAITIGVTIAEATAEIAANPQLYDRIQEQLNQIDNFQNALDCSICRAIERAREAMEICVLDYHDEVYWNAFAAGFDAWANETYGADEIDCDAVCVGE